MTEPDESLCIRSDGFARRGLGVHASSVPLCSTSPQRSTRSSSARLTLRYSVRLRRLGRRPSSAAPTTPSRCRRRSTPSGRFGGACGGSASSVAAPWSSCRLGFPCPGWSSPACTGMELLIDGARQIDPRAVPFESAVEASIRKPTRAPAGIIVERKAGVSVTLHWRMALIERTTCSASPTILRAARPCPVAYRIRGRAPAPGRDS